MSPGDQLISVLINSVGVLFAAMINSLFSVFFVPIFEAIAAAIGIPV